MKIAETAFIAPGAIVMGDVTVGEQASIWYHATVRGDCEPITIGPGSNVQDNCVVHVGTGYPVKIGEHVTIGHGAIIHGCTIGDCSLVGMGAILMNGCSIGSNCIVGAGALVTEGMEIPNNSLVLGSPAKVRRAVTGEEIAQSMRNAAHYVREASVKRISKPVKDAD